LSPRLRELLDALEEWIVTDGFASLTIEKMVARLKCSRSTLYGVAPSREELVLVIIDRRLRRIGAMKRDRLAALDSPAEKIRVLIGSQDLQIQSTSIRFMEDVARTPAVQRLIGDHLRYGVAQLQDLIQEGISSGTFRSGANSRVVAHAIDAALQRIQDPVVLRESGRSFDEASADIATLFLDGLVQSRR
jgi:AcrR family transcriptional regulator